MPPIMTTAAIAMPIMRAHAAEHDDGEDHRRFQEDEGFRADEALARGEERAGEAAEHGADRKGRELGVGGVDAERAAGDLVLAQRLPGAADRQAAQPLVTKAVSSASSQDQVVEEDLVVGRAHRQAEDLGEAVRRGVERQCRRSVTFGMPEMPKPPFVTSRQLMSTRRMISPKASVTMAR